jgi:hypothetical protein
MSNPPLTHIKHLYHRYRNTPDISTQALFISPTCLQICRPIPTFSASSREQIIQYSKDAQSGTLSLDNTSQAVEENVTATNDANNQTENDGASNVKEQGDLETSKGAELAKLVYAIRPLLPSDTPFSMSEATTLPIELTPSALKKRSKDEKWIGMRVYLWDDGPADDSLLVKVQYWWRWEPVPMGEEMDGDADEHGWRQCLHDIITLGPKDGTEKEDGFEVLSRVF